MMMVFGIFIGGGIGAVLRYYSTVFARLLLGDGFPYGTMFVNILGSFIIGVILESVALKWSLTATQQAFIVTGILGGFTTFSAFSFDIYRLANTGQLISAAVYACLSVFLSLLAVFGGAYLMRGVLS